MRSPPAGGARGSTRPLVPPEAQLAHLAARSHGSHRVAWRSQGGPKACSPVLDAEHQVVSVRPSSEQVSVGSKSGVSSAPRAASSANASTWRSHVQKGVLRPQASSCGHGEPPSCSGGAPGSRGSGLSRETVQGGRGGAVLGAGRTALSPTSCSTGAASRLPAAWPSHGLVVEKSENPQPWGGLRRASEATSSLQATEAVPWRT